MNDGGPAFPRHYGVQTHAGLESQLWSEGMSLRDYFAATIDIPWEHARAIASMQLACAATTRQVIECRAQLRYAEADAMLAHRNVVIAEQQFANR